MEAVQTMGSKLALAKDRREDRRVHAEIEAFLHIVSLPPCDLPPPKKLKGMTSDVSTGGSRLVLMTDVRIPVDTCFRLRLRTPYKTFKLKGVVCWETRKSNVGSHVLGVNLSPSSRLALMAWRRYVTRRILKNAAPDARERPTGR